MVKFFLENKAEQLRAKVHRNEDQINLALKSLRLKAFGVTSAFNDESEVRHLFSNFGTEELVNILYNEAIKKLGVNALAKERARCKEEYDELRNLINIEMAKPRRLLNDFPELRLDIVVTNGKFSYKAEAVEKYIKDKCTAHLDPAKEQYINYLLKLHTLALEIDDFERKNGLPTETLGGRIARTWGGIEYARFPLSDIAEMREPEKYKNFLIERFID